MLKKLLLLSLLFLTGCSGYNATELKKIATIPGASVNVYSTVIENCEYLVYDRSITHKGSCTNDAHKLILVLPIPVEVEKKREYSFK